MYEDEMAKELEEMLPCFLKELEQTPEKEFIKDLESQGADFIPLKEYNGDIIRIDRLIEFLPTKYWSQDGAKKIYLDDISAAIQKALPEISSPYGDTWKYPVTEHKSREWHIGRIIYFINHPDEIKDVEIDNECNGSYILPRPIIVDGWHRYAAARWLYSQGKLFKIHCKYGGRIDILEYLQGKTNSFNYESVQKDRRKLL